MNTTKKILIWGILTEIIYLIFFLIDPLRKYYGDTSLTLSLNNFYFLITTLLFGAGFFYFMASRLELNQKSFRLALIFFGIFSLTNLASHPLTSIDAYTYIHTSRVLSVHQQNPYIHNFDEFPSDTFASQIKNCWSNKPTPYAPLFTVISSTLSFIGQHNLTFSLYLFKIFFVILNILSLYLVFLISKDYKTTFLYAWNPLLLFEFGINAHNDIVSVFFLLLALYYSQKNNFKSYLTALGFLFLSALIKYITAIFLPLAIWFYFHKLENRREKTNFFFASLLLSIFIITLFYLPFWSGPEIFSRLFSQASNFSRAWIFSSPLIIVLASILSIFKISGIIPLATQAAKLVFIISYLLILVYVIFKKNTTRLNKTFIISLTIFYFSFFTWLMPWYLSVLLVLLILENKSETRYFYLAHALTFYSFFYYLILR